MESGGGGRERRTQGWQLLDLLCYLAGPVDSTLRWESRGGHRLHGGSRCEKAPHSACHQCRTNASCDASCSLWALKMCCRDSYCRAVSRKSTNIRVSKAMKVINGVREGGSSVYGSTKGFVSYGGFTHVGFPLRTSVSPPTLYPSSLQLPLSPLSPSPVTTFPSSSLSCSPLPRPPSPSPAVWLRHPFLCEW